MPPSSNVLSFVPVPNPEHGQRRTSAQSARPAGVDDEAVLRKIAEAALSATGAEGAALALRRDGAVVCVARAGEMAPPLGAHLSETSGMSGECLREGTALRCDDTETDTRVDAEACRSLGLRALAVAPIQQADAQGGETVASVIGILEVFSPNPSTFTDRHMEVLRQLAELVAAETAVHSADLEPPDVESPPIAKSPPETAAVPQPRLLPAKLVEDAPAVATVEAPEEALFEAKIGTAVETPVATPAPLPIKPRTEKPQAGKIVATSLSATPLPADVNISAYMAAHEKAQAQNHPRVPKIVLVGLATLVVASFVGWYFRHWTPSGTSSTVATLPATVVPAPAPAPGVETPPVSAQAPANSGFGPALTASPTTARPEHDPVTDAASKSRIASNTTVTRPIHVVPSPVAAPVESDAAPGLPADPAGGKTSDQVTALLNVPSALPVRAPPVSQGVEGGELESRVNAIYPPQARARGQQGIVVIDALVGPNGSVRDVKVVSGPPLLRQAAMDAVRLWKYQPFKLNGKPIAAQTQVQVEFKLQ